MSSLTANQKGKEAVKNFREYLQITSVHPNVNYDACIKFLKNQEKILNLGIQTYYVAPTKPVLVLTWTGTEPLLPTILLHSHMDVVPVFEEKWTHKPFGADVDSQNNIYARGAQDMKSVGIQYLEAIRRLKQHGIILRRTVHVLFVPDEEKTDGGIGMKEFVDSKDFENLNVGVALDEGIASPTEEFAFFNGERLTWPLYIHCCGSPGHGSFLLSNTAGAQVAFLLDKFYTLRQQEKQKLAGNSSYTNGDVITVNLTKIEGGVQSNVIPSEFLLIFDSRIPPDADIDKFEATIKQWCKNAGSGAWLDSTYKPPPSASTKLDNTNPYWIAFKKASDELGLKLKVQIFPAGTNSYYIRQKGIPAFGFSPINSTPVLLHDNDEYLGVDTFLTGIEIYYKILISIGNVENVIQN